MAHQPARIGETLRDLRFLRVRIALDEEGLEREDQAAELCELGCGLVQGYWFDRSVEPWHLELDGFNARVRPGLGDPPVIHELMRQIGVPARIQ